ncbi:MAG TPA: hypothetical protein ENI66_00025 [Candidatus Yonathbacteria bacterium]|nr:hypothetical protein [Candidatus Yonathbacteria bacterium]
MTTKAFAGSIITGSINKLSGVLERLKSPFMGNSSNIKKVLLGGLETLRNDRGAFVAALSDDYNACWMRDQLYSNFAYYYIGNTKEFKKGMWVVFDMLRNSQRKIEKAICYPPRQSADFIHAKFGDKLLEEITNDWGHHQVDAIGLFLYVVGFAKEKGIELTRDETDKEIIQLLVSYLTAVRYWEDPDNGMWEEGLALHASSIGAAVRGLQTIKDTKLAVVPQKLIDHGVSALFEILPNESPDRDRDMAQLSLIWPYNVLPPYITETVIDRITEKLIQPKGLNRYMDDNYYRSDNGISAEWTMGFFWLSIIFAEQGKKKEAESWFARGMETITSEGLLPELYQNGEPNKNTPLGWSHSLALIAQEKIKKIK